MGIKINNRGIAVIALALGMIALVAIVGLAVDIGYMYVAKGQLQNAADAAALAGAVRLDGTNSTNQNNARVEAAKFAQANTAAGASVIIASDNSNTLSAINVSGGNDITFGNWNPSLTPSYLAGRIPFNAIQVRTRRTVSNASADNQGQVGIFFGRIFSLLPGGGVGWPFMSASAEAIANITYLASPFPVCLKACGTTTSLTGTKFFLKTKDGSPNIGWTSLLNNSTNEPVITQIIKNNGGHANCGDCIFTTEGIVTPSLNAINDMVAAHSTTVKINGTNVTGWEVLLPILSDDPKACDSGSKNSTGCFIDPGSQAHSSDPYKIINFAKAVVLRADTGSNPGIVSVGEDPPYGAGTSSLGANCGSVCNNLPQNFLSASLVR